MSKTKRVAQAIALSERCSGSVVDILTIARLVCGEETFFTFKNGDLTYTLRADRAIADADRALLIGLLHQATAGGVSPVLEAP